MKGMNLMRIDKFLKVSRLIKRRTIASEACEKKRVKINGKEVKPSSNVKEGDIIEIDFGKSTTKIEVLNVIEHVNKDQARELYKLV